MKSPLMSPSKDETHRVTLRGPRDPGVGSKANVDWSHRTVNPLALNGPPGV